MHNEITENKEQTLEVVSCFRPKKKQNTKDGEDRSYRFPVRYFPCSTIKSSVAPFPAMKSPQWRTGALLRDEGSVRYEERFAAVSMFSFL